MFLGIPGLKVIAPSNLHDPGQLLINCIDDEGPVLFIENKVLYIERLKTSEAGYLEHFSCKIEGRLFPTILLSAADFENADVTVVAYGGMVPLVMEATKEMLLCEEIICEIIIPSSLKPLNVLPILDSVRKTGRIVVVEEGSIGYGFTSEISALVAENNVVRLLKSPIQRIAAKDIPIGCAKTIEDNNLPSKDEIIKAIMRVC